MPFLRSQPYFERRFHDKQEEAWLAYKAGLDLVLPWGRRSGKSDLFSEILIEDIEENGHDCLFVAKTQRQARKIIWKKSQLRLKDQPGWKLNESKLEAAYKGGPSIAIRGADVSEDNLTGSGYRVIACDEYALWRKPDIVKRVLAPMLGDYSGQFLFGSTKRGKNHFHKLHQTALGNPDKYYVSEATIFDNPYIDDAGRAKVLSEYAGAEDPLYKQEILNEYVTFEGKAFAIPTGTYTERKWDAGDLTHSYHWRGMDHGFNPDPTACVWIAYNKRKGYFQVYNEYRESKLLINQHADVIRGAEPYSFIDTISDIDPQLIAEYEEIGLPLTAAGKHNKQARILRIVNALRTGKLKIADHCTMLLDEMDNYEWGQDGNDHLCLAAGTFITTECGDLPIERVQTSDRVLTRSGWQDVSAWGYTGIRETLKLEFSDGAFLVCTENHPIYTENRGFVRADALTYADRFCTYNAWASEKRSSLTALPSADIRMPRPDRSAGISSVVRCILSRAFATCTERFGSLITGLFPTASMCTIGTETHSITTFLISNASQANSIKSSIARRDPLEPSHQNSATCLNESDRLQKNGTPLEPVTTGMSSTASVFSGIARLWKPCALFAVRREECRTHGKTAQNIALRNAQPRRAENLDWTTSPAPAECVRSHSEPADSQRSSIARGNAVGLVAVHRVGQRKVYNLSVKSRPEYFANGVLVHNCDALNYGYTNLILPDEHPHDDEDSYRDRLKINPAGQYAQDFGD